MGNLPEIDWKGLWETNGNIDTRIPLLELFEKSSNDPKEEVNLPKDDTKCLWASSIRSHNYVKEMPSVNAK